MTKSALLIALFALLAISAPLAAESNFSLPDFGDSGGRLISPSQERILGGAFFRSLHSQMRINQDPEIQQYIDSLGNKLSAHSGNPKQPFHFFVVVEPTINAFAGPGGYIGINSGLILVSETESELASVISHEIAHVTQRHLVDSFEAAGNMSIPNAVALLAAILIGTQAPELGQAALIAAQALSVQKRINFTRSNEQEADRIGMQTLSKAHFNPRDMPIFFERMERGSRYFGEGPPEFLRTHPVTASRIADTRGRAEQYTFRHYSDSLAYLLFRAKLRVMTAKRPDVSVRYFKSRANIGTGMQRAANHYGLALALIAASQPKQARPILQALVRQAPGQPLFINALANAEMKAGNPTKALAHYRKAEQRFPGNRAITLNHAKVLLHTGRYQQAHTLMRAYSRTHTPTPELYLLLGQAAGNLGRKAEAHRYQAEHHYAKGELKPAITQIELGLKAAKGNFYLTAIFDERLKKFTEEEEATEEMMER